ncbi:MAG: hypothetical protein ACM3SQ_00785 [Betaproteobacteria bacterium]
MLTFDEACTRVESALTGSLRRDLVADAAAAPGFARALQHLREALRAHVLEAGACRVDLNPFVTAFDRLTVEDGFNALHDWDGVAGHVNPETIPIDVLDYLVEKRGDEAPDATAIAILLDYYFLNVLALLSLRVWDEGSADENLGRLDRLLELLQGPDGSGQRFADNSSTLILIATAHYEPAEWGYDRLLERTRSLDERHRTRTALLHGAAMGSHLRFGFEATYGRDTLVMRDDNVADYPWLCFALATLMDAYMRIRDAGQRDEARARVVESMLNGLTADPRAFVGRAAPGSLAAHEAERASFARRFQAVRDDLLEEFRAFRPTAEAYSPLSFFFNFSHNVVKGAVVDALIWGEAWDVGLDDLLTGIPRGGPRPESKEALAKTLMAYARANPHRVRGRLMPVIVYDPEAGHRAFALTLRKLEE